MNLFIIIFNIIFFLKQIYLYYYFNYYEIINIFFINCSYFTFLFNLNEKNQYNFFYLSLYDKFSFYLH